MKELYLTSENRKMKAKSWTKMINNDQSKKSKPFSLRDSALLVIDLQSFFLESSSHAFVPSSPAVLEIAVPIVETYRRHSRPVIFTTFAVKKNEEDPIRNWWGDSVHVGSKESEIVESLLPTEKEKVLRKSSYSCFYKTDLEKYLRKERIKQVTIIGVVTNLCCDMAARELFVRGFDVFPVVDGMAAYTEADHLSTLKNMALGYATLIHSKDILSPLNRNRRRG